MKRLSSNWPLQLVKVIGSAIPPLDFNILDLRDYYTKRSSVCLVRLVKTIENSSLSHLYFFGLKGLYYEKGILEFPFRLFSNSLKIEKDRVILVVKLVKTIATNLSIQKRESFTIARLVKT